MAGKLRQYLSMSGGALLLGAVLVVGAIAVVFGGEHALSRTEFCVSCHSQTYPYEELKSPRTMARSAPILAARTATSPRAWATST